MAITVTLENGCSTKGRGRKTIIADYCQRRSQEEGYERFILLCLERGGRYCAIDIPIKPDDPALGLDRLRKESGRLWKRYSLYSAIAVQEINMRLMKVDQPASGPPEIRVSVLPIDYSNQISQLDREIQAESDGLVPFVCGIDVDGNSHDGDDCPNVAVDNICEGLYCKASRVRMLSRQQSDYRWLPPILKYYWQNGIDKNGLRFLNQVGFVHSYNEMQYDTYSDAVAPYGRTIPAFLLVEGWRIRYLLVLIGVSVSGSICVIAITAALAQSLDIALTAGSYACGLSGALIAVFTFLSAVL